MSDKFNEGSVCSGCWNRDNDKTECVDKCERLHAFQRNQPWYHIAPYKEVKMEQKEEVTIPAPIKSDGSPLTPFGIKLKIDAGECFLCESKGNRRGFCGQHYDSWRKGYIEHPVEGLWKPNRKTRPKKVVAKKTIKHGISDEALRNVEKSLDAAVKRIDARYNPQELHTVKEILDEEKRIEGRKETKDKVDYSCIPMETLDGVARVFLQGSVKYGGTRTWMPGIPFRKLCSAIVRHLVSWYWLKEDVDAESGESHLSHIIANSMMLLSFKDEKKFDDR